jgi:cob(I)alamin adenosyltransferase
LRLAALESWRAKNRILMPKKRLEKGLIQVYTGDGKGKTTCALGLALRAAGQGFKVFIVQFLKGQQTGESAAAARLAPEVTLRYFGRPGLVNLKAPAPEDLALVQQAWELARKVLAAGEHDLVILDEINLCLTHGLVPLEEALEVLQHRPPWVEVILTGRQAPPELLALADLITEMLPLKHYYQAGVKARRGIEW